MDVACMMVEVTSTFFGEMLMYSVVLEHHSCYS